MTAPRVEWSISEKELAAFTKRVERFRGLPLRARMAKATLKAADYLVRPIRANTPKGPTGNLRRQVRARPAKKRIGTTLAPTLGALVGPTSPHRHLVIQGHRIVTPSGRDTGRRSTPNPFVDEAVQRHKGEAMRLVSRILFEG